MLFAFGNNHAGTYYPVALAALPFLGEILERGGEWARIATLDILIDLSASFEPEPSFRIVATPVGDMMELSTLLRNGVAGLSGAVRNIANAEAAGAHERALATELLSYLEGDGADG